jgi:hypothetical protein
MEINLHNLKQVLDRYYEGLSTLEEENALRYFFKSEHVPAEFETDKAMFTFASTNVISESSEELNHTLWNAIHEGAEKKAERKSKIIRRISWISIAASALLIIGLNWLLTQKNQPNLLADTYDDPAIALQQTREILLKISGSMNKGLSELESLSSMDNAMGKLAPLGELSKQIDRVYQIEALYHPFVLQDGTKKFDPE